MSRIRPFINTDSIKAMIGIREAVYGGNLRDINLTLENIVFLEMLRRGYKVTVGKISDKEIDFVL